jgi:hypothetical protein
VFGTWLRQPCTVTAPAIYLVPQVYQAPDMKLLDNKLVKLDGVQVCDHACIM